VAKDCPHLDRLTGRAHRPRAGYALKTLITVLRLLKREKKVLKKSLRCKTNPRVDLTDNCRRNSQE